MNVSQLADTYVDTSALHKGQLWVDHHNLGRFWWIGPQHALYLPGPWLKVGGNAIVLFDLKGKAGEHVSTRTAPLFGESTSIRN